MEVVPSRSSNGRRAGRSSACYRAWGAAVPPAASRTAKTFLSQILISQSKLVPFSQAAEVFLGDGPRSLCRFRRPLPSSPSYAPKLYARDPSSRAGQGLFVKEPPDAEVFAKLRPSLCDVWLGRRPVLLDRCCIVADLLNQLAEATHRMSLGELPRKQSFARRAEFDNPGIWILSALRNHGSHANRGWTRECRFLAGRTKT
jgi:hypothetical protein